MNNLKVRQAINYAIDRAALVKIFGGQGTPTENIVPPGMGRRTSRTRFYPYDLAKAKELVAELGHQGHGGPGLVVTTPTRSRQAAQYMASVLNSLGYKATVKTLTEGDLLRHGLRPRRPTPRSPTTTGTRTSRRREDYIDAHVQRQRHHQRRQQRQRPTSNVPSLNSADRRGARRCRSAPRATPCGRGSTPRS